MAPSKRDLQDTGLVSMLSVCMFGAGVMVGVAVGVEAMGFLEKWQTLIGAFAALIAAAGTIGIVRRQIASSEEGVQRQIDNQITIEADKLTRKLVASRAVLPSDLSGICEYCRECLASINDAMNFKKPILEGIGYTPAFVRPALSDSVIKNLQLLIENAPNMNESTVETLVELLGCYQIQHVRFRNILDRASEASKDKSHSVMVDDFNSSLSSTIELYLRAEQLFGFARSKEDAASRFSYNREKLNRHLLTGMKLEGRFSHQQLDDVNWIISSGDWRLK